MAKAKAQPEAVTSGPPMPDVTVRVTNATIVYEDVAYTDGDTLELPGRTADHLVLSGQVEVVTDE